jgi:hypothetical protein
VRRRLEARAPADAAARQEGDLRVAEEPGGGLRDVARVGVLGREHDERAGKLFVERGEQQWKRRLGDARPRGWELGHERAKTLALGELVHERVQHRSVHDERRNTGFRGPNRSPGAVPY